MIRFSQIQWRSPRGGEQHRLPAAVRPRTHWASARSRVQPSLPHRSWQTTDTRMGYRSGSSRIRNWDKGSREGVTPLRGGIETGNRVRMEPNGKKAGRAAVRKRRVLGVDPCDGCCRSLPGMTYIPFGIAALCRDVLFDCACYGPRSVRIPARSQFASTRHSVRRRRDDSRRVGTLHSHKSWPFPWEVSLIPPDRLEMRDLQ
jgi:hypothetical protein